MDNWAVRYLRQRCLRGKMINRRIGVLIAPLGCLIWHFHDEAEHDTFGMFWARRLAAPSMLQWAHSYYISCSSPMSLNMLPSAYVPSSNWLIVTLYYNFPAIILFCNPVQDVLVAVRLRLLNCRLAFPNISK